MKSVFTCTILYYNTPVFYKVSRLAHNEYYAEALTDNMISFNFQKQNGEWYGEGETSHHLAAQIGKQIDQLKSNGDHNSQSSTL